MPLYQPHTHLNLYLEFSWHRYPTVPNGPSVLHRWTHFTVCCENATECFGRKFMKSIDIMTSCKHLVCVSCQSKLKYCMDLIKFGKVFCFWVDWKIFITQNRCNVLKAVLHLCFNIFCLSLLLRLVSNDVTAFSHTDGHSTHWLASPPLAPHGNIPTFFINSCL